MEGMEVGMIQSIPEIQCNRSKEASPPEISVAYNYDLHEKILHREANHYPTLANSQVLGDLSRTLEILALYISPRYLNSPRVYTRKGKEGGKEQ